MVISKMIEKLQKLQKDIGDVEVMVQGTMLPNNGETIFDSTIETLHATTYKDRKIVKLFWQM